MNTKRKTRYVSSPEPPAGVTLTEKSYREETSPAGSNENKDDDCSPKPTGRLQSDNVYMKYAGRCLKIGSWNTRTLFVQGKLDNLMKESKEMNLDILGVSEHRWTGEGTVIRDTHTFIYSGGTEHKHGVGILCKSNIAQYIMGVWPVSPRNMLIKFRAKPFDISIIQTYAPTTDYSEEEIEEYYEEIQNIMKNVKSTEVLIIMGDFNAKVGKGREEDIVGHFGLGERNERGERLVQFCIENNLMITNTFFQKPERKLYTWKSPGDWTRNQIDYILIRKRFRNSVKTCQTYPGADINSDHNPITAKLKIKLKKVKIPQRKRDIDVNALKASIELQDKYRVTVANTYDALSESHQEQYEQADAAEQINLKWNIFKESIHQGNEDIPKKERKTNKPWMTQDILDLMSERKTKKGKPEYNEINKNIQQECRKAKDKWLNLKCAEIEIYGLNSKQAHEEIRLISGRQRKVNRNSCIKDKDGKILFEENEIQERWCQYIGELFDDERPQLPTPSNTDGPQILPCEIENALSKMKEGKANGDDGISTEMLKALNTFTVEKLTNLFNDIYNSGHLPEEMAKSVYITLPKKPMATECGDFRTISLMPHVTKLLLRIILERMKSRIDSEVGDTQFGFRPESGTREAIFCLNTACQKYRENKKDIYACFIDYAKAFDRVHHKEIINCLEKIGVDGKDIRLITNLYWHQKAAIRIKGELTPYTSIKRGVRQGCVLSPYLFNIYTEFIFRKTNELPGINMGGRNINNLRYADDTVLLTENETQLQTLTTAVKKNSEDVGLDMNVKKTKVMVMSRDKGRECKVDIDDTTLEQVENYKYLGQQIKATNNCKTEVMIRIGIAKSRFSQLKGILTAQWTRMATKMRILKCYVHSALLYGSETWTLNRNLEKRIEAFEMWTFRRIGKISWKDRVTNEDVCNSIAQTPTLLKTIKKRKLKYFGHLRRHDNITKQFLEGRVNGKRPRGRPATIWMDDIRAWTGLTATECSTRATDRGMWRAISSRPLPKRWHRR